ncbi:MAG: adenylate kinase [Bacteroidales bacterium]|nr:adenylate kinase [Bacteroidales bacterium]
MRYFILFGPPGAGKGTHAGAIGRKYNMKHISTGELLRAEIAAGTELGKHAQELISAGSLVPDEVVEGMIENAFDTIKGYDGFLLDGFPRTLGQAKDLDRILAKRGEKVDAVISIMIPDDIVRERIRHRATVEGRADDASESTITNRINTYHTRTEPLIQFYKEAGNYYEADGYPGTIEQNQKRILDMISEKIGD